ncbi:MAG TPA: acyl-CoA dehydrogenase family protein [Kofleriaceae bacterium]|nr:acyl-CoA dehydrogenase family protein [Kofleriaceae bacterium]
MNDSTKTSPNKTSPIEKLAGTPLRIITQLGSNELVDKLGLRDATEKALHGVGHAAGKLMGGMPKKKKAKNGDAKAAPTVPTQKKENGAAAAGTAPPPARLATVAATGVFDLRPTEDQDLIRQTAKRFADEVMRKAAYAADNAATPDLKVLAAAQELGLAMLVVPDAAGGIAESRALMTTVLAIEELARGDMGLALAMLAPLGVVNALVEYGTHAQQQAWLPRFTGDTFVPAALALLEPAPGSDPSRPQTGAVRAPGGWKLFGEKSLVPLGESAELFLVLAEIKGAGPRLFLVPKGTLGVTVTRQPAMGLRAAGTCKLRFDGAFIPGDALLGGEEARGSFDAQAVVDRARIAWGAMAVGGAKAVLDYVIPYCNERKAFGEPVSNRQAVAFMIADLAIELEGMALLVHRAASLADQGKRVTREANLVRVQCTAKGMKAGTDGVQLLGGHGFVKEHPVERWYRDLRAIGVMEGAL